MEKNSEDDTPLPKLVEDLLLESAALLLEAVAGTAADLDFPGILISLPNG